MQKFVTLVDLKECCEISICLQKPASMQPRTGPRKLHDFLSICSSPDLGIQIACTRLLIYRLDKQSYAILINLTKIEKMTENTSQPGRPHRATKCPRAKTKVCHPEYQKSWLPIRNIPSGSPSDAVMNFRPHNLEVLDHLHPRSFNNVMYISQDTSIIRKQVTFVIQ